MSFARVLVVDDDFLIRETLNAALNEDFDVSEAASGAECLASVAQSAPDLLLLDIEMPDLDGYEVCKQLRQQYEFPIIFISARDSLEEQLLGFDAGADDFVTKPFNAEVLFRQVKRVIARRQEAQTAQVEREQMQELASDVLRDLDQTDVLLKFMRESIGCSDYRRLARNLLAATQSYGVSCHVQLRYPEGSETLTGKEAASGAELGVFAQCAGLGKVFRFGRRLIVNFPNVSILLLATPDSEEQTLRLQEKLSVLAESCEAVCETIEVRRESAFRAEALQIGSASCYQAVESLRDQYRQQQEATQLRLQQLVDDVEASYLFLGLTERQEAAVSDSIRERSNEILCLFQRSEALEAQFSAILDALMPNGRQGSCVELF